MPITPANSHLKHKREIVSTIIVLILVFSSFTALEWWYQRPLSGALGPQTSIHSQIMGSGVLFSNSTFDYSISYVWIKSFYGGFGGYSEGLNGTPPGSSNKYLSINSITIPGENFSQVSCGEPQFYPTITVGATSGSCQVESPIMPGEPYNYTIALSNGMIFQNGEVADCLPRDCTISVTSA
jgi:hypothetical protein